MHNTYLAGNTATERRVQKGDTAADATCAIVPPIGLPATTPVIVPLLLCASAQLQSQRSLPKCLALLRKQHSPKARMGCAERYAIDIAQKTHYDDYGITIL